VVVVLVEVVCRDEHDVGAEPQQLPPPPTTEEEEQHSSEVSFAIGAVLTVVVVSTSPGAVVTVIRLFHS